MKNRFCLLFCVIFVIVISFSGCGNKEEIPPQTSSEESSEPSSSETQSQEEFVDLGNGYTLSADYSNLLLVNGENPLPEDYDYEGNLVEIDQKYINGSLNKFDKEAYPYMAAMIEAAWAEGVRLYVWSPYRSYDIQTMLFKKQVQRCIDSGVPSDKAEDKAATVVARPGTSEHNTGLGVDFNMADDAFEKTEMYSWLCENAADYGFIMRYAADKQDKTGVIYESWHWRFVGIKAAREIKASGKCLEEYLEK